MSQVPVSGLLLWPREVASPVQGRAQGGEPAGRAGPAHVRQGQPYGSIKPPPPRRGTAVPPRMLGLPLPQHAPTASHRIPPPFTDPAP